MDLRRRVLLCLLAPFLFLPLIGSGQKLEDKVTLRRLTNGLTVIIAERHGAPTFSAIYGFKVGSVDEVPGITGVAHLFEHMAFKGTPKIGTSDFAKEKPIMDESNAVGRELSLELLKGDAADKDKIKALKGKLANLDGDEKQYIVKDEIDKIYSAAGGTGLNASTGNDVTQYYVSLPSNRFELFCLVESERLKNAVLREFYTERSVIQEERKQTTEASPDRMLSEAFMGAAFVAHPYNHPVVGWASDINSVTLEEAMAFKKKFYTPKNCVITICGDIYPAKAFPLIEKYFGDWPSGDDPPVLRTVEPQQLGERRLRYEADAEPSLIMGFHKPNFPSRDDAILTVISSLLTSGRSSIMYKDMIKAKQLASTVNTSPTYPGVRFPNLFAVMASPRYPHTNEEIEKTVLEHLDRIKQQPVTEAELQKVKNSLEASELRMMKSNMGLARSLTQYQLLFGDWRLFLKRKEMIASVTPQEIMECAKKFFVPENMTVAYLIKKSN